MKNLPINCLKLFVIVSVIFSFSAAATAQSNLPCTPPPAGLISWLTADGNTIDVQGGNNGTLNGATFTSAVNGKAREAFSFDGSDDFVEVSHNAANSDTTATWEFWLKTSQPDTPNGTGLIGKHDATASFNGITIFMNAGKIGVQIKAAGNANALNLTSLGILNDGQYHHIALTFQSGGATSLYIDGKLNDTGTAPSFSFNSNPLRLGRTLDTYWSPFNGTIDEFSIFDRPLASHEIFAIYNSGANGKCKPVANQALLVSDLTTHSIRKYDAQTGEFIATLVAAGSGGLDQPYGLVFDGANTLYVADYSNDRIKRYDIRTGAFLGDLNNGASAMNGPVGMIIGHDGKLYVADELGNRVLRFDLGSGAFDSVFVMAGSGGLATPYDVEFVPDSTGDNVPELVVSTGFNNNLLRYNGATGAFIGVFSNANLSYPNFMTTNSDGLLYVSNYFNNTVTRYNAVTGAFIDVFASDAGSNGFIGLTFGTDGNLFVSHITNKVRKFSGTNGTSLTNLINDSNLTDPTGLLFVPALCSTAPAGQVAFYTADGTATDAQGANEGTLQNGAFYTSGKAGSAAFSFDGIDDFVEIPDSPTLEVSTQMTLEAWIKPAVGSTGNRTIYSKFGNDNRAFYIFVTPSNGIGGEFSGDGNTFNQVASGANAITTGVWQHVAVTFNSGTVTFYVNGTPVVSNSIPVTAINNAGNREVNIGRDSRNVEYFKGEIDEVALYNQSASAADVQNIYKAGKGGKCRPANACTLPPAQMVSWYRGEDDANDTLATNSGTSSGTFAAGKVGRAFSLDGSSQFVNIPDNPTFNATSLTLDAWVNPDTLTGSDGYRNIITKYDTSLGPTGASFYLTMLNGGNLNFGVVQNNSSYRAITTNNPVLTAGAWQHVAAVFDYQTQELNIYVNGVKAISTLDATVAKVKIVDSAAPVRLGVLRDAGGNLKGFWDGLIDEVAILDRALSQNEIQAIYNAGTAGKCLAPNLSMSVAASPTTVYINQNWDLTATIGNTGLGAASSVKLTAALPAGVQFVGASHMDCAASGQIVTCSIGSLAANRFAQKENLAPEASVTRTITVQPTQTGALSIPFNATADEADAVVANNFFAANINVLAPTAAGVSIGGRITTADGRGIRNAAVTLIENDGTTRTVLSGTFGYYRFNDIAAGQNVFVRVSAKRFRFVPNVVTVNVTENNDEVNFRAQP